LVFATEPVEVTQQVQLVRIASSLAMEHWLATLALLRGGLFSAAAVVHRAQYEALLRSVWLHYCANEAHVEKLSHELTAETAQAAQSLAQSSEMTKAVESTAPTPLVAALRGFRENSWKVLNSYAHAGLHPIRHHEDDYPSFLFEATAKNANGLGMLGAMHTASLTEDEAFMRHIHSLQVKYSDCFAPK
jgi:hypothetical protein